jgi:DNA-binding GntR family transcriptional regulator
VAVTGSTIVTKQEHVYQSIRERILSGAYGPGYRVVIDALAEEFEVSGLPVREAVRRLEAEELVIYRPNAGAQVAPADPGMFDEEMASRFSTTPASSASTSSTTLATTTKPAAHR